MTAPPRLAVITDVPVERTHAGMLLLYRLLADYPADRLLVVDGRFYSSAGPSVRLPAVEYRRFEYPDRRPHWLPPRLTPAWRVWADFRMPSLGPRLAEFVRDFRPDAVLTVADYFLWVAAAAAARRLDVPLHLVLHDDHPGKMTGHGSRPWSGLLRGAHRRTLGRVYRQAASRLAVSPNMADVYRAAFGPPAQVLYPNRGDDSPEPRVRVRAGGGPPVVAFTGSPNVGGVNGLLGRLAERLGRVGGELHLYTKATADDLAALGLVQPAVRRIGFFSPREMADRLGGTAHALFLPAAFEPQRRAEISTLFPSKMADYTAVGLPILIWGPGYSSAARWGHENPTAAVTITDPGGGQVLPAVERMACDPGWAAALASSAVAAGRRYFDLQAARDQLRAALAAGGGG